MSTDVSAEDRVISLGSGFAAIPERLMLAHARGELIVDGERAEQAQRLDIVPGRHPLRQQRGGVGLIGRLEGGDPWRSHRAVLLLGSASISKA